MFTDADMTQLGIYAVKHNILPASAFEEQGIDISAISNEKPKYLTVIVRKENLGCMFEDSEGSRYRMDGGQGFRVSGYVAKDKEGEYLKDDNLIALIADYSKIQTTDSTEQLKVSKIVEIKQRTLEHTADQVLQEMSNVLLGKGVLQENVKGFLTNLPNLGKYTVYIPTACIKMCG